MLPGCIRASQEEVPQSFVVCPKLGFRRHLVSAIRAAVRLFKPLLDAVITKDMLAPWQPEWGLINALGIAHAELVVADHAH